MNFVIGDSRVKCFKQGMFRNNITNVWTKPGSKLEHICGMIDKLTILHHDEQPLTSRNNFYISSGICNLTDRLLERESQYQEVVFNQKPDHYYENIASQIKSISRHATSQYGRAIFCTIYPMSFRVWNKTLLNTNKTIVLRQQQNYEAMQRDLELAVEKVNDIIINANIENGVTTPLFHYNMLHNRGKSVKKQKYNMLIDGCHPNNQLQYKCKRSLQKAIENNSQ